MIPDIALLRDKLNHVSRWRNKIYRVLAVGWKGTDVQKQLLEKCMNIMTAIILPVAISVHTVVAWLLAMTLRTGWNSTILGPYFVSGAIMSGAAAVLIAMAVFRKAYNLEQYITNVHFKKLSLLLFVLTIIYAYFNINEYGVPAYKMEKAESEYLNELFYGTHAPLYWSVQILGLLVPLILLAFSRIRNSISWIVFAASLIVVGAMVKRYIIVIPTMLHPFVPIQNAPIGYGSYFPSVVEWLVTLGAVAGFMLVYTLFSKLFPIITLWETSDAIKNKGAESVGVGLQISSTVSN
jgi:molybdopterin-containing oxidoreductase family membrane subunit